jgi:hypothetical protein
MRTKASRLPLVLVAAWAVLLVSFMVLRPRPHEARFWILVGAAIVVGVSYMLLEHLDSRRTEKDAAAWYARLMAAADVQDYVDDGHLHEWLDADERERLIQELQRMPPGARSLKRALGIVSPELIDENA